MVPAEKISTIPMMTEANQPQFSRPIMHMKPVPMTASVATAIPIGPVSAASTVSSMVWIGDKSCAKAGLARAAKVVVAGKRRLRRCRSMRSSLVLLKIDEDRRAGWNPVCDADVRRGNRCTRKSGPDPVDARDVVAGLDERRDAGILDHPVRSGIVGRERQVDVLERSELCEQIPRRAVEVLGGIARIDAERTGSIRHQLAKTIGILRADGGRVVAAFSLDQGAEQNLPVVRIKADLPQGTVPLVADGSRADQGEGVVATGRRRGVQRGQNDLGFSAMFQTSPGRALTVKGPARSPGCAVAAEGDNVSRAPRG